MSLWRSSLYFVYVVGSYVLFAVKSNCPNHRSRGALFHTANLGVLTKSVFVIESTNLSTELLFINDPITLVDGYRAGLQKLLDKHAPFNTKTVVVRP